MKRITPTVSILVAFCFGSLGLACSSVVAGNTTDEEDEDTDSAEVADGGASGDGDAATEPGTGGSDDGETGSGGGNSVPVQDFDCDQLIADMELNCTDYGDENVRSNEMWGPGCRSYGALNIQAGVAMMETDPFGDPSVLIVDTLEVTMGAELSSTGQGYLGGVGPGKGVPAGSTGTGAGHGGVGEAIGAEPGGETYGDPDYPITAGSGGGAAGGAGGGAMLVCARESITIHGKISSNGADSTAPGAGAGGSVLLITPTVAGNGEVEARGGRAMSGILCAGMGGDGGGGRIAILTSDNQFSSGDGEGSLDVTPRSNGCEPAGSGTQKILDLP